MFAYHKRFRNALSRFAVMVLLSAVIYGCSTPNIEYLSRETVKKYINNENETQQFASISPQSKVGKTKRPMSLGAMRITRKDAEEGNPGQLIMFQRKRGVYIAETEIPNSGNARYFFSIGIDPRNQKPALAFRIEF
jgi:hypothetical protein